MIPIWCVMNCFDLFLNAKKFCLERSNHRLQCIHFLGGVSQHLGEKYLVVRACCELNLIFIKNELLKDQTKKNSGEHRIAKCFEFILRNPVSFGIFRTESLRK